MAEEERRDEAEKKPEKLPAGEDAGEKGEQVDYASKYLSDALGTSFKILKVIMFIGIMVWVLSGLATVKEGNEGLLLRFGRIVERGRSGKQSEQDNG